MGGVLKSGAEVSGNDHKITNSQITGLVSGNNNQLENVTLEAGAAVRGNSNELKQVVMPSGSSVDGNHNGLTRVTLEPGVAIRGNGKDYRDKTLTIVDIQSEAPKQNGQYIHGVLYPNCDGKLTINSSTGSVPQCDGVEMKALGQ